MRHRGLLALIAIGIASPVGPLLAQRSVGGHNFTLRLSAVHVAGQRFSYRAPGGGVGELSSAYGIGFQAVYESAWLVAPFVDYRYVLANLETAAALFRTNDRIGYSTVALGAQFPLRLLGRMRVGPVVAVHWILGDDVPQYSTTGVGFALDVRLTGRWSVHGQVMLPRQARSADWRRSGVLLYDATPRWISLGVTWRLKRAAA